MKTKNNAPKIQVVRNKRGRKVETINPVFNDFCFMSRKLMNFSYQIMTFRQKHCLSQEEFAQICNLYGQAQHITFSPAAISQYENCKNVPKSDRFQIIADVLHIDPKNF